MFKTIVDIALMTAVLSFRVWVCQELFSAGLACERDFLVIAQQVPVAVPPELAALVRAESSLLDPFVLDYWFSALRADRTIG